MTGSSDRYEAMQELLEQREAELDSIKEERRDKDAAINFLKMKIVSLQNQSKVHADTTLGQASRGPPPSETDESLQLALEERDRTISELETELSRVRQETERSQRAVHRLSSGGLAWELEEARRRLAERDREVESLRRSLEWQENETKRIAERSAADLEDLRQHFIVRDREVTELKRALEELEGSRREHHLEVELRHHAEQSRRLAAKSQRSEEEAEDLRQQLRQAREEVEFLWRSIREQSLQQEEGNVLHRDNHLPTAVGGFSSSPMQSPRLSVSSRTSRMASAELPLGSESQKSHQLSSSTEASSRPSRTKSAEVSPSSEATRRFSSSSAEVPPRGPSRMTSAETQSQRDPLASPRTEWMERERRKAPVAHECSRENPRMSPRGALPTAGAEAAAGDHIPLVSTLLSPTSNIQRREISPSRCGQQTVPPPAPPEEQWETCEAADEGAGTARRNTEETKVDLHIDRAEICTQEDLQLAKQLQSPDVVDLPMEECELQPVCATFGGAVFSINFDGEEDIAAKEAKKQRMARQIERRRQARLQSGGTEVGTNSSKMRPEPGEELATASQGEVTPRLSDDCRFEPVEQVPETLRAEQVWCQSVSSPHNSPRLTSPNAPGSPMFAVRIETTSGCTSPPPMQVTSPACLSETSSSKTPTLHSKFAGLRDEMKRRRSKNALGSTQVQLDQMAEEVIAEANGNNVPMSSRVAAVEQAVAVAVGSVATATAVASRVLASSSLSSERTSSASQSLAGVLEVSPSLASNPLGTSPLHSARATKTSTATVKSPGERVITTTSSMNLVCEPSSSSGQTPNFLHGHGQRSCPQSPQASPPFYIPLGTLPPSPSSKSSMSSASVPAYPQASPTARHQHPVQRLRSMPQESTSTARSSGTSELDRSRRNTLSYSARSVHVSTGSSGGNSHGFPGNGSSRFPAGQSTRPGSAEVSNNDVEQLDQLHDAVVRFAMQRPAGRYPLVRISRGVYLYGNKKLVIAMHNEKLMARIGGGFVNLESYLNDCDRTTPSAMHAPTSPVSPTGHFEQAPRLAGVATSRGLLAGRRR